MKAILLLLLFPLAAFAQDLKPARRIEFASHKEPGLAIGLMSVSPRGNLLLATFNDFDKKSVYELFSLIDGKKISAGDLRGIPNSVSWSEDEKLAAITFSKGNPGCFNVRSGMKEIFTCSSEGEVAFSRNTSLIAKPEPQLYLFGADAVYIYSINGKIKDSVERDNDYKTYKAAWFDMVNKKFNLLNELDAEITSYTIAGKAIATTPLSGAIEISETDVDKDGSKLLVRNKFDLFVYDLSNGKKILEHPLSEVTAACFTPDSKAIILRDGDQFQIIDLNGKQLGAVKVDEYYSMLAYTGFGTELVAIEPDGADIYACKNYLPISKETAAIKTTPKEKPVEFTPPVIIKDDVSAQETVKEKWNLPYTISDFITPKITDSVVLYNKERSVKYMIKYNKHKEADFLAKNPYDFFQFFGFGTAEKYDVGYVYTLDMGNGDAKITMYSDLTKKAGDIMFGGNNFWAKTPVSNLAIVWDNKIYSDKIDCTANLIDNVYKGKKGKCLVVKMGGSAGKTYYYQQGVGLIKIETGGVTFER